MVDSDEYHIERLIITQTTVDQLSWFISLALFGSDGGYNLIWFTRCQNRHPFNVINSLLLTRVSLLIKTSTRSSKKDNSTQTIKVTWLQFLTFQSNCWAKCRRNSTEWMSNRRTDKEKGRHTPKQSQYELNVEKYLFNAWKIGASKTILRCRYRN